MTTQLPSIYFPENNPELEAIYQNEIVNRYYYWPLLMTQSSLNLSASGLANNNPAVYYTYSGDIWQYTTVTKQKDGRYRNITIRSVDDDVFNFYLHTALSPDEVYYHAGPVTVSGSYYTLTKYESIDAAELNAVEFTPGMNQGVISLSGVEQARSVTLAHQATASGLTYRLYQFLPRTSIEVDDLSAEVIDVVTLRVSDSIVVSPDIPNKSITGDKILDGTVSGVLITPGTITSNEIAANTITAFNLNVDQLDAVAANMGNLVVNSGISIGDNGRLYVGSGEYTVINASGLSFKNPVQVTPPWTGPTAGEGLTIGQVQQYPPDVNSIKFAPYYYDASGILYDFDPPRYSTLIGQVQYREPGLSLDEVGNYSTFSIDAGWLPSESGQAYYVPTERSSAYFSTKSVADSSLILSASTPTTSSFISLRNNAITISGTGAGPSLNLSIPTVVDSASFAVVQKTPSLPGFPPITTELQTVTASEAVFNVPVIFNEGATQPSITLTCTATQAGTAINPAWNSAIQNTGFTWIGTRVYIPVTGYYTIDFNYSLSGGSSNRVDLYIDEVNVGRLANTNDEIGNRYRSTGTRYCTAGSSVQVVLLLATSRTLLVTAYGASYESPILHIVKVG